MDATIIKTNYATEFTTQERHVLGENSENTLLSCPQRMAS